MHKKKVDSGYSIRLIRNSLSLTQKQFGEKLGVTASCVQHWEVNYSEPNFETLRKIKEVFNVSYEEIIDGM